MNFLNRFPLYGRAEGKISTYEIDFQKLLQLIFLRFLIACFVTGWPFSGKPGKVREFRKAWKKPGKVKESLRFFEQSGNFIILMKRNVAHERVP